MQLLEFVTRSVLSGSAVFELVAAELVISGGKNRDDSLKSINRAAKTAAPAAQNRDVMAQVGVDASRYSLFSQ